MISIANKWLEKYEIKKPDYDYIDRDFVDMSNIKGDNFRYVKNNGVWKVRDTKNSDEGTIKLMFVGDITCFDKQFEAAKQGDGYNFNYEFEQVKPIFAQADLVVGNLETMIFPNAPYRIEKHVSEQNFHCNAPIEFLDAIRNSGIDMLTNANNHDLDTGAIGIGETIDNIDRFGFIHTGTFKSDKKRYEMIDVNGFKIAIVAFAMEHNNKKCNLTLEGIDFLLNDYSREKAQKIIENAYADGAEAVFTCIHWGTENKIIQNTEQEKIAKELTSLGYSCIIGSHPHVLQPFTLLNEGDRDVPVFYSMGNFISHNVNNRKSRSIIACIDLERKGKDIDIKPSYIPVFTSGNYGDKEYVVLPINEKCFDSRNLKKLEQIKAIIGEQIEINSEIEFIECIEKKEKDTESALKKENFKLSTVKEYPVIYDDKKFTYLIHKHHVYITGISKDSKSGAYSVPERLFNLPIIGISDGAFENNQVVRKINFRKNIPFIHKRMCKNCTLLEGFQLGSNTIEIKEEAFANCINLSAVVMKNTVIKIYSKAFSNCKNLRSVKIPSNVVDIADDSFEGCQNVTFYCEENSYADIYARRHGFKVVNMKLY